MTDIDGTDSDSLSGLEREMTRLNASAKLFGTTLSKAFASGIAQGKGFEDILKGIGGKLIELSLRQAFKPLEQVLGLAMSGLGKGLSGVFSGNFGGDFGSVATPFASGGVISTPHFFPLGRGMGVAGERGAEAILPLARGPDGRLGVASTSGGGVSVTMNITTPDAPSFLKSQGQVSAALARAVAQGQRNL